MNNKVRHTANVRGITMIEVVMVIVISAILVSVALKSVVTVTETGRVEETKQEMEQLDFAIQGNPDLENSGVRTDFGYVGDVGALPEGLDSLYNRPSGYTTWNGPYIERKFSQITNDFKEDAWGVSYSYNGGIEITSTGSGSNIVRKLANSADDLLSNGVTGIILDNDGAPPGSECDTVRIDLILPDGTGGILRDSTYPDASGYFSFESVPIGNHDLEIIYMPLDDTLRRFVSVLPNSVLYQEYFLTFRPWSEITPTSSCFEYVAGSASTIGAGSICDGIEFRVHNTCGVPKEINSITLVWSSPTAFYQYVVWDGKNVVARTSDRVASGETAVFSGGTNQGWADGGEIIEVSVELFRDTQASGSPDPVVMSSVDFTVTLSDGSTFTFNSGTCP